MTFFVNFWLCYIFCFRLDFPDNRAYTQYSARVRIRNIETNSRAPAKILSKQQANSSTCYWSAVINYVCMFQSRFSFVFFPHLENMLWIWAVCVRISINKSEWIHRRQLYSPCVAFAFALRLPLIWFLFLLFFLRLAVCFFDFCAFTEECEKRAKREACVGVGVHGQTETATAMATANHW